MWGGSCDHYRSATGEDLMQRPARGATLTMAAPQKVSVAAVASVTSELESLFQLKKRKQRL